MAFSTSNMGIQNQDGRWAREIELQKTFQLTQTEAKLMVAKENGQSVQEIAEVEGLTVQTVKNKLTSAKKKIVGEGMLEFYIIRQNTPNSDKAMRANNLARVIAELCQCMGYKVIFMNHVIVVRGLQKQTPGDINWFVNNVERLVDMVGTRSDAGSKERAERMMEAYKRRVMEQNVQEQMFGHAVMKYYLDKYWIPYDVYDME